MPTRENVRNGSSARDHLSEDDVISTAVTSGEAESDVPLQSVELLRSMISYKEVNRIAGQRSNIEGLKQTAFHGGFIAFAGLLTKLALMYKNGEANAFLGWSALLIAILAQGYFLSFLFMPLHECVHMTAFASRWMNKSLGFIVGLASIRPPVHYKLYHFAHHRFTENREKDPELSDSLLDPDIKTLSGYIFYLSSIPFWISRPTTIIRHALGMISPTGEYFIATSEQKEEITSEARLFCLLYALMAVASFAFGSYSILPYWVIPTLVGQPFLRFYLLAEHTGCQLGINMLANTRTTVTSALYRKLAWNMPYHAEHHAWPSVPFHLLPKVNSLIQGSEKRSGCNPSGESGYFGVHVGVLKGIKHRQE